MSRRLVLSLSALFLLVGLAGCPTVNPNEQEADDARALNPASERILEYQPNASVTDPIEPARGMPQN